MFGAGFYEGVSEAREQNRNRRAKVFQAFQQWKQDNPYATAADFQNAVRAIGGGDLSIAGTLPGNQAIQRMAADNARKKQEAEKQQQFERLQKQLNMETTKLNLARAAVETYGDKADANQLAKQFGIPAEVFAPAIEQARSENEARRAKETQANNVKALEYYMGAANAALEAGRTPQEAHDAGLAASGRFASAAGFDLDLGAVGKPSGFQSGTSNHLADMQVTYDAKKEARSNAIKEDIAKRIADNPALLDQAVADPSGAISAAALGIYDESDPAFAAALSDMEARVGVLADQRKQQQDKADRDRASAAYATLSETTGQDLVLGREDDTRTAIINNLIGQGLTEERATAAADEVLSSNQPMLETAFDTQYNDVGQLRIDLQQGAANRASAYLANRIDSDKGIVIANIDGKPSHAVGETHIRQITNAMSSHIFADEAEQNAFYNALVKAAVGRAGKGDFADTSELIEAASKIFENEMKYRPVTVGALYENLVDDQQDNFSSTSEMVAADLDRANAIDTAYPSRSASRAGSGNFEVDITAEKIEEANQIRNPSARKAELSYINSALTDAIQDAEAYLEAVIAGEVNPVILGELPAEHRLGRGVSYEPDVHITGIRQRIADLQERRRATNRYASFATSAATPHANGEPPALLPNYISVPQGNGVRDVAFSEAMATPEPRLQLFGDSLQATLNVAVQRDPALANAIPTVLQAIDSSSSAQDPKVVEAIASSLEAFDYMREFAMTASTSEFNAFLAENQITLYGSGVRGASSSGVSPEMGPLTIITADDVDKAARAYAEKWVSWHLSGHSDAQQLSQEIGDLMLMLYDRVGMERTNVTDAARGRPLDLPRVRAN